MPVVLDLVNENFSNFSNIIFFMGIIVERKFLKKLIKELGPGVYRKKKFN